MHEHTKHFWIGVSLIFLACICLASLSACAKAASMTMNVEVVTFYQFFLTLLCYLPVVAHKGIRSLKTTSPWLHLLRDAMGLLTFYLFYYSLNSIPLIDATLLYNTSPLFIPIIAFIWLHVYIPPRLWVCILIGFIGIIIILHPGGGQLLKIGALLALLSGIASAVANVTVRKLTLTESLESILFYYFLFCSIVLALILSFFNLWAWPVGVEWGYIVALTISFLFFQYFVAKAYKFVLPSRVAPFRFFAVIFAGLIGWWIWNEIPSWLTLLGIILVIIGAVLSITVRHTPE